MELPNYDRVAGALRGLGFTVSIVPNDSFDALVFAAMNPSTSVYAWFIAIRDVPQDLIASCVETLVHLTSRSTPFLQWLSAPIQVGANYVG